MDDEDLRTRSKMGEEREEGEEADHNQDSINEVEDDEVPFLRPLHPELNTNRDTTKTNAQETETARGQDNGKTGAQKQETKRCSVDGEGATQDNMHGVFADIQPLLDRFEQMHGHILFNLTVPRSWRRMSVVSPVLVVANTSGLAPTAPSQSEKGDQQLNSDLLFDGNVPYREDGERAETPSASAKRETVLQPSYHLHNASFGELIAFVHRWRLMLRRTSLLRLKPISIQVCGLVLCCMRGVYMGLWLCFHPYLQILHPIIVVIQHRNVPTGFPLNAFVERRVCTQCHGRAG